jgi:hypothetical protein
VTPLLVEPEDGGCRAAQNLCGLPVVQADGSALPLADATLDAAWSLGVCTTPHQLDAAHGTAPTGAVTGTHRAARVRGTPVGVR